MGSGEGGAEGGGGGVDGGGRGGKISTTEIESAVAGRESTDAMDDVTSLVVTGLLLDPLT